MNFLVGDDGLDTRDLALSAARIKILSVIGGRRWTRTIDLVIISDAL